MTNSKCKLGNRGERGEHSFHSMVNNDLVNMPIISFITAHYAHSKYTCSMCKTCVPFSAYLHNEEAIDGFQMPIKHSTFGGQACDQHVIKRQLYSEKQFLISFSTNAKDSL